MQPTLDEATSRFLATAQADLQRHLGSAGDNLVTAFGALTRSHAAPARTLPIHHRKR